MDNSLRASSATADSQAASGEEKFITELIGLCSFIEQQNSIEDSLKQLTSLVSYLLKVQNYSIILLKTDDDSSSPKHRVLAHHGFLPEETYDQSVSLDQGISGHVASSGELLLIVEIRHSSSAAAARRSKHEGFISFPLIIADKVVGVLNVSRPTDKRVLGQPELTMVNMVALLVSTSIPVFLLQHLLNTNVIALALETQTSRIIQ